VIVRQFKNDLAERFAAQERARIEGRKFRDERIKRLEEEHRELDRNFLTHLAALPREYVRREDHIRFETVITAKLDALGSRIELLAERQQVRT